ncbi:MAG: YkgJ family cysteine cluster protein [Clostridia bacterium]|nr:YkgJ family cysteine cluster protein [Clostridia bacterium]
MKKTPIQKLYEKIPSFSCKEGCTRCCDNWVQCAPEEEARCGKFEFTDRLCPKLKGDEGCSVYEDRPFICRLFGSAENLPCPYGYGPEKPLTKEEASALLREYLKQKRKQEEALHGKNDG